MGVSFSVLILICLQGQNNSSSFVKTYDSAVVNYPINLVEGHDNDMFLCGTQGQNVPAGKFYFQIISQHGKVLNEQPLTKERNKIDMTIYSSGIYFLRLTNKQNRIVGSGKWIKQ